MDRSSIPNQLWGNKMGKTFKDKKKLVEGSPAEQARDRQMARKHKMSMKDWEGSPMDEKMDREGYKSGGTVRGMGVAKRGGDYKIC